MRGSIKQKPLRVHTAGMSERRFNLLFCVSECMCVCVHLHLHDHMSVCMSVVRLRAPGISGLASLGVSGLGLARGAWRGGTGRCDTPWMEAVSATP